MGSISGGFGATSNIPDIDIPPFTPPEVPVPEETVPTTVRQVVDFPREADILVGDTLTDSSGGLWTVVESVAATTGEDVLVTRVCLVAQDFTNTDTPIAEGEIDGARSSETGWLTARSWAVAAGTLRAGSNWLADTLLDTFAAEPDGNTQMRMIVRTANRTAFGAGTARLRGHIIYDRTRSRQTNTVFYPAAYRVAADVNRASYQTLAADIIAAGVESATLVRPRVEISSGVREVVLWDGAGLRLDNEHLAILFPSESATAFDGLTDSDPEGSGFFDYTVQDICVNKESVLPMFEMLVQGSLTFFLTRTPLTIPAGQHVTLTATLRPRQTQ